MANKPRAPKNEPQSIEEAVEIQMASERDEAVDLSTKDNVEPTELTVHVTREDFDNAVKFLQNEISALRVVVDDLQTVVTQPQGSVVFSSVEREQQAEAEEVEDYVPGVQRAFDREGDGIGWY